jgi:cAMP-dependent protein kinase regulator
VALTWFGGQATVDELVAGKKYAKALRLLREQFEAGNRDARLRTQLADVLVLAGRVTEALPVYLALADELARGDQTARAVAVLKKVERLEPGRKDVQDRLARLAERPKAPAAPLPAREPSVVWLEPEAVQKAAEPIEVEPEVEPEASQDDVAGAADMRLPPNPLFEGFAPEELLAVMRGLRLATYEAGDIVLAEGEAGDSLFLVSSGIVKAFVKSPSGRYVEVRELREGDFFGEISVLSGKPRSATVTAAAPTELLELDRRTIDSITSLHPRVREVLFTFCQERSNSSLESLVRGMRFGHKA